MSFDSLISGLSDSPNMPTFLRLLLALAIGLFVGMERERRRKEAGVRTFAFAALLGAVGGMLGDSYALMALGLVGILVVLLNVEAVRTGDGAELTTSAALVLTAFTGVLAGVGQTFTPMVLGVTTAALLAWKTPLAEFTTALTESELRSAVLFAIMAFVVYPVLPEGPIGPGDLIDVRDAWVTVILISALGFLNYVLLRVYGTRGLGVTSLLGGLVNSTATVAELARRARLSPTGPERAFVYRGVLLASFAMIVRNALIVGLIAPPALVRAAVPFGFMLLVSFLFVRFAGRMTPATEEPVSTDGTVALRSPFSLTAALQFGAILLALHVCATMAQRAIGDAGVYIVSAIGGLISSASATASAATLFSDGNLAASTAAAAATFASLTSLFVNVPLVMRLLAGTPESRRIIISIMIICACGVAGAILQQQF
jgi:uncharacterized membrane protein (DUF4010 family)